MLRQIVSVSLAMTACAIFIPTKANALSLTFAPIGELPKQPGDFITFTISVDPKPYNEVTFTALHRVEGYDGYEWDDEELDFDNIKMLATTYQTFSQPGSIAEVTFKARNNLKKDGKKDFFNVAAVFDIIELGAVGVIAKTDGSDEKIVDIVPVPEPLTIFGAATALGYGAIFKRKSSKKTVS
jgi:hypothetical protein